MENSLRNTMALGFALLFVVIFWTFYEISKSHALIELARDPDASIQRGIADARSDYSEGHAHFLSVYIEGNGRVYPGVLQDEIDGKYKDYALQYLWCGTGLHLGGIALDILHHEKNEYHALSYNLELVKILHNAKKI